MKFNKIETALLIYILNSHLKQINSTIKLPSYDNLFTKLEKGEFVKGRLLNFLYSEISQVKVDLNSNQIEILDSLLKRIKFKATPR